MNQQSLLTIFKKTDGKCFYCGNNEAFIIEHFFPKAKIRELGEWGGDPNILENLFLACQNCNLKKKDKFPEDFMENAWEKYDQANIKGGIIPLFLMIKTNTKSI